MDDMDDEDEELDELEEDEDDYVYEAPVSQTAGPRRLSH